MAGISAAAAVRSELEYEQTWRLDELRFLENLLCEIEGEDEQRRMRKALVVMLYSHYEGFCKVCLLVYLRALNRAGLRCAEVNSALAAASLSPLFNMIVSGGKHPVFRRQLPDDSKLHSLSRRIDFLSKLPLVLSESVSLDDELVNTSSNLSSIVLKKNLFQLGLNEELVEPHRIGIDRLVSERNAIAHGVRRDGPDESDYLKLRAAALSVIEGVASAIVSAVEQKQYQCATPRIEFA